MPSADIAYQTIQESSRSYISIEPNHHENNETDLDLEHQSLIHERAIANTINQTRTKSKQSWDIYIKVVCLSLIISSITISLIIWQSPLLINNSFFLNDLLVHSYDRDRDQSTTTAIHSYDRVFNQWKGYCQSHNNVLPRGDQVLGRLAGYDGSRRIWTMNNQTINFIDHIKNPTLPSCQSSDQVLRSLQYGTRVSLQHINDFIHSNNHRLGDQTINQLIDQSVDQIYNRSASVNGMINQTELHESLFIPSHCTIEWQSSESTCSILSQYSHVSVVGDSMSRHFMQSMYATLTEDWRMGGLPLLSSQSELYDSCQCDGMYSEHKFCRTFAADHIFRSTDLRSYGVCYDSVDAKHPPMILKHHPNHGPHGAEQVDWSYMCNGNDTRPRFIYLQGIWHFDKADPQKVIESLIDPLLTAITHTSNSVCEKPFRFHLLFTGGHAQSRWLDERYPHQSRQRMAENNVVLKEHIESRWGHKAMDFWNLTRDAPSGDGLHHLTEVNLLKVQYVLNYMKMLT